MKKLTLRRQHLINVYCIIIYQINSRDGNNYTNVTHVCVMVCPSPYSMNMDRLLLFDILHTILEQARVMVRPCPYMIFTINDNTHSLKSIDMDGLKFEGEAMWSMHGSLFQEHSFRGGGVGAIPCRGLFKQDQKIY